jgi:CubicO group peptidase (beta-lactamase class C family)
MKNFRSIGLLATLLFALALSAAAQATGANKDLGAAINALLAETFKPNEPGAAVIVVKDGQAVFRKGYGMANLELGVPIEPDMIFRIGSVTKQFTAVAVLMLAEQGKLSLSDEITRFLPDYPTQGHKITVEHLLTHTSGVKSYTELPEFGQQMRKDLSLKELIDSFKDKPMDFAPGEGWHYSNSGFVLLGAIIEKASGQTYVDFVEKNIFAPLGMTHSFYDNTQRVIPRRVAGYGKISDGYVNAYYLSMNLPYAAGSLISSVDDLALWDAALYTEKLVKQESLRRAWTPFKLNNGKSTGYGYGWGISMLEGQRKIAHNGGINGFSCDTLRLPESHVYVAILTNRNTGTANLTKKLALLAIGKEWRDPVAIKLPAATLDKYVGVYQLNEKQEAVVTRENDALFLAQPQTGKVEIQPLSETEFFVKRSPDVRLGFQRQENGAFTGFVLRPGFGPDDEATKTDKPLPKPKVAAALAPAMYDGYVGEYEIAPGFTISISKEGDKLMGQATGQPKAELHPESPTTFAVKEANAQIEFVGESGKTTSLILNQGGRKMTAKKIK